MERTDSDMDLSEFILSTKAAYNPITREWDVKIPLADGTIGTCHVDGAYSEFEAYEGAFHYLLERIYGQEKTS